MPIVMMILGAVGAAIWWWIRSNPRDAAYVARDAVTVVRNAPRKLAFRRQLNAHPVEGIDDPRIAICAIGQAFLELERLPTQEQRHRFNLLLRTKLNATDAEAEEMEVLGRWLMAQCNDAKAAIPRLGRRLHKLDGTASWDRLQDFLAALIDGDLTPGQIDAIDDLRIAFRM